MEQRRMDLVELAKDYGDKWVALDENRSFVAFGDSLKEVLIAAESKGIEFPFVVYVARDFGSLATLV